ncbi:4-alpha-glucanotransferase [Ranunculus cassubicifolius]
MGHVLLLPFPAQGHINPMIQFGKRLVSKGLRVTLAITVFLSKSMHIKGCTVGIETISDGFDDSGPLGAGGVDGLQWMRDVYFNSLKEVGSRTLADIIKKYSHGNEPITCLVCDSFASWGLDVGKEFRLVTGLFFTQTCSMGATVYRAQQGLLSVPVEEPSVSIPGLPLLAPQDFHSSLVIVDEMDLVLLLAQFTSVDKADWLLFNSFDNLESEVVKVMGKIWRVRTTGPTTPSMYLDKRVEGDYENSLNIFKPSDGSDIKWLNGKKSGSVLYISFGSMAELGKEQMEEIICGIKESNKEFMWVVRETEQSKLPAGFAEEMINKGLLVPWCSQLEVLAHDSIGCFLTHCGWNSTLEALSLGVPMVAMPQIWDQFTNAKFIADVWEIGIRVKKNREGIVKREELDSCIREVMDGERGKVIKTNAVRWRELAKDAVDAGGSSDLNIQEFAVSVMST